MKLRESLFVATVVTTLLTPLAALAGTITTSPLGAAAPAIGMPMLVLLALVLSVGAVYVLRRKAASATARLAGMAAVIIVAGIAYATTNVVVSGAQCTMRTTQMWNAIYPKMLENQCSNALLLEVIDPDCNFLTGSAGAPLDSFPSCVMGQTLAAGAICHLPICVS